MDWRQNCSNRVCPWLQTCLNQHCFLWGKNNVVLPQTFTTCRQNGLVNTQQNILDFCCCWLALISFSLPKLSTRQQVVAEWIFQGNSVKCYDMMTQSLDLLIVCCVLDDWTSSVEHDIFQNVSAGNLKSKLSKKLSFCGGIAHVCYFQCFKNPCNVFTMSGTGCLAAQVGHIRCLIGIAGKIFSFWKNSTSSTSATSWWRWRKSSMVSGRYQNAVSCSRWRMSSMLHGIW